MDLSKKLIALVKVMNVNFTLNSKPISYEKVFAVDGLLPGLARRADQLCSLCLGYGIGVTFEESEGTTLGTKVSFDEATPNILRLLCIGDVLSEIIKSASSSDSVPLDELMYD